MRGCQGYTTMKVPLKCTSIVEPWHYRGVCGAGRKGAETAIIMPAKSRVWQREEDREEKRVEDCGWNCQTMAVVGFSHFISGRASSSHLERLFFSPPPTRKTHSLTPKAITLLFSLPPLSLPLPLLSISLFLSPSLSLFVYCERCIKLKVCRLRA